MDGIHDMGGMHGFGPVTVGATESGEEGWEGRLQAVAMLSRSFSRSGVEQTPPDVYLASTYHERWITAVEERSLARGTLSSEALNRWNELFAGSDSAMPPRTENKDNVAAITALLASSEFIDHATTPRFAVHDDVQVRRMRPEVHHRCPRYLRGAVGTVEKIVGQSPVPGLKPDAASTDAIYTVRFSSVTLWGERSTAGELEYDLFIDLWERYLEAS